MGYLIKANQFVTYTSTVDAADIITCGSIPVKLNSFANGDFNGTFFTPLFASLKLVNNTVPFDFAAGDHLTIKDNNVNIAISIYFYWKELLNNFQNDIPYTSTYLQQDHNLGGANITTNYNPQKQQNLYLNTINFADCSQGDGQLKIIIGGVITQF